MKAERILTVAVGGLLVLILPVGCAKSEKDLVLGAGEIKHYQVPVGGTAKRNLSVYLPGGYSKSGESYPVLYLLHGDDGDDLTFLGGGYRAYGGMMSDANVSVIMDKLLQEKRSKPLIVACPAWGSDKDVLRYFVPFVDATFRTIPKRESRAIAGHSMGGYHSLYISLAHPEAFSVAGGFSSLGLSTSLAEYTKANDLKSNPVFYWLYAGTRDQNGVTQPNKDFVGFLRKNGLATTYVEDDGDHVSGVARRLTEFVEYLSKRLKW